MYKIPEPIEIKNNVCRIGKEKGFKTMKSIAEASKIDFGTIYGWYQYYPTLYNLMCVANALDCTLDDLIEVKDNEIE